MELKITKCPLCQSNNISDFLKTKDYFFSEEHFGIDKCEKCGLLFTNPRPPDEELQDYYESEKYLSHTDKRDSLFSVLYQYIKKYALRKKLGIIGRYAETGSLLDIGCGTGEYISLARKKGWDVKGVEQNEGARNIALKKGLDVYSSIEEVTKLDEKFNGITLWHVLEHLPDMHHAIEIVSEKIREDGVLVIALPNLNAWDADHYGETWAAYDLPRHLYHFNRKTIQTLLSIYGFDLKTTLPMVFDAYYVSILSEQYKKNKFALPAGAFKGLWSNVRAWQSKEYSSLIYVFQRNS